MSLVKPHSSIAAMAKDVDAILDSSRRTAEFIETFREKNSMLATLFDRKISKHLAARGWFVGGRLYPREFVKLSKAFERGQEEKIESFLVERVAADLPDIRREVTNGWPDRKTILLEAFEAHDEERYCLSIPVFIAQADGMALEILGAYLFTRRSGDISKAVRDLVAARYNHRPLARSFFGLLLETSGLAVDTNVRDEQILARGPSSSLNRHGVLHGVDLDYARIENGLRSVALVDFLTWTSRVTEDVRRDQATASSDK